MILLVSSTAFAEDGDLPAAFQVFFSGIDNRGPLIPESRSDANIIITVNTDTKQILLVHIPRDFTLEFAGMEGYYDKLTNSGLFGNQTVMETVNKLFQTDIQYFIRFNFQGFIDFIDAMGGVDVYSEFTMQTGNQPGASFVKGINEDVDGTSALAYCRERYSYDTGDLQRGRNQMWTIMAAVKAFTKGDALQNFQTILDNTTGCYETNVPMAYVVKMLQAQQAEGSDWNVVMYGCNGIDSESPTGAYLMEPDMTTVEHAKELMQRVINGEILDQVKDAPRTSIVESVTDLWGEQTIRNVQTVLKEAGYYTGEVDGRYGPATEDAIRRYQEEHGLSISGKADRGTVKALGLEIVSIPQDGE